MSILAVLGNICVQMYSLHHPDFVPQPWHVFVVYLIATWLGCGIIVFGHKVLPMLNTVGLFFIVTGVLITVVVCAAMPGTDSRPPHAPSSFVWSSWSADIGYDSQGFVFLMGMLNGAFAVGAPDCASHLSEEVPRPERNVPLAIAAQMTIGFFTGLAYLIALFYSIYNLDDIYSNAGTFPIAQIYLQATSSPAGATGLLFLIMIPTALNSIGAQLTASRTLWTLARDRATPFSKTFSVVSEKLGNPVNAQLVTAVLSSVIGCIYVFLNPPKMRDRPADGSI